MLYEVITEAVSVNDEVVIIKNNEVLGVGRALMSGKEMKKATVITSYSIHYTKLYEIIIFIYG